MDAVLARLAELGGWAYGLVGAFAFLETSALLGLFTPGETVVVVGGLLAGQGRLSPVGVAAAAAIGAILGDTVGYELGRHFGTRLLNAVRFRRRALGRAERTFRSHAGKAVFFGRFVGFLRTFAPVLAGIARMPYPRFLVCNAAGGILWAASFTVLGYVAGANWRVIERWMSWIGVGIAMAIVIVFLARWRPWRPRGRTDGMKRARTVVAGVGLPLTAGVAVVAALLWITGPGAAFRTLARLHPGEIVALLVAAFTSSAFAALALRVILRRYGHCVSPWLLFRLSILAFAVGWLVPSGYVAGFPVAAYLLKRRGVPFGRGLAAFLIERFLELSAYALFLPTALLSGATSGAGLVAALCAPIAVVLFIAADLAFRWQLGRRGLTFLVPWVPGRAAPAVHRGIDFLGTIAWFFGSSLPLLGSAIGLSVLAIGASFARAVMTARFLNLGLGVPQVALLVAFSLVVLAIPLLPGAIGVYEGGMVGFFQLLGRPSSQGIAFAMVIHGVELVVAAVGVLFLVQLGVSLAAMRRAAAEAGT
jgi:membrane-associated protein